MKNVSVENGVRWMLAALMLLATSVTSATYVHGHSGGNLAHQHDKSDRTIAYSFAPTAFNNGRDGDLSLSAVDVHHHGLLMLLGTITYQPTPGESCCSHEKSPRGPEMIVAVSAAQGVRTLSKSLAVDHSGPTSLAILSISCIRESKQHETLCAGVAPASPLCDRARHERSGVQLT
ncbi:MAG: hypothetical protein ACYC0Y_02325 [Pirellulales bacterium]